MEQLFYSGIMRRVDMTEDEIRFLQMIHDPEIREDLLARLEKQGLLSAFLAIENGTN